jgi:hypothetical protein
MPKVRKQSKVISPTIRLAATTTLMKVSNDDFCRTHYMFHQDNMEAPTVRLAATCALMEHDNDDATADRYPFHRKNVQTPTDTARKKLPASRAPALLVSFFYLKNWLRNRHRYIIRDWVLDSGAFTALQQNIEIDLKDYIETCKRLIDEEEQLTEIYALDVIGDWRKSLANTERMWKAGIPAIPCYHSGEPWDYLLGIAKDYPKIAIGGMVGMHGKKIITFADQCFARVWPKPIHGFGVGGRDLIQRLPWHSVDATNWELGPVGFGRWNAFGHMSVRGSRQNLRAEVEFYLDLETRIRARWEREMAKLGDVPTLRDQSKKLCAQSTD